MWRAKSISLRGPDMRSMRMTILPLLMLCSLGCYTSRHYHGTPESNDLVFFGNPDLDGRAGTPQAIIHEDTFRNHFMFGLIPETDDSLHFVGRKLERPAGNPGGIISGLEITTKKSALAALTEGVASLGPIIAVLRPFVFNFRSIRVTAHEHGGPPTPDD